MSHNVTGLKTKKTARMRSVKNKLNPTNQQETTGKIMLDFDNTPPFRYELFTHNQIELK